MKYRKYPVCIWIYNSYSCYHSYHYHNYIAETSRETNKSVIGYAVGGAAGIVVLVGIAVLAGRQICYIGK